MLLKTIDHPKAREWIAKIDTLEGRQARRGIPLLYVAGAALLAIVLVVAAFLVGRGSGGETVAALAPNATTDTRPTLPPAFTPTNAPVATSVPQADPILRAGVVAALQTYCDSVTNRSQGACRRWANAVWEAESVWATACDYEYDWISDTDSFSFCLADRGIYAWSESAVSSPFPEMLSDADARKYIVPIVFCQQRDYGSDDLCGAWGLIVVVEQEALFSECYDRFPAQGQILALFDCFDRVGLRPT